MGALLHTASGLLQHELIVAVSVFQDTASVPAMIIAVTTDLFARIVAVVR